MNTRFLRPLFVLLLTCTAFGMLHAQDDEPQQPALSAERLQEIKAQKSAFITQRLSLTPEQARTFWPIYDRYEAEKEALRKEMRSGRSGNRGQQKQKLTEAEAEQLLNQRLANKTKELDLRTRYTEQFKKSIGAVKTLELEGVERDFNRELLKRVRSQGQERGK